MHQLRSFYYENKEKIWKVVLFIVFLLLIIQFFNNRAIEDMENKNISTEKENINYVDDENRIYISDKSAISGEKVNKTEVVKINNTISKFLQYCKNRNVQQAYDMLSQDCKLNVYPTIEQFEKKYIDLKFTVNDVFEIEKWIGETYKISNSDNLLETGKKENGDKAIEYITVVSEESQDKLNINNYVGKKVINKEKAQNDITITVVSKLVYIDYEIYNFEIENLSEHTIKLDTQQKIGTMYIKDNKGKCYNAQSSEILGEELEIKSKHKKQLTIKYLNRYSTDEEIENIYFDNVILDYIKYKTSNNIENFKEMCQIKVNI